jgi:hypothetical protein
MLAGCVQAPRHSVNTLHVLTPAAEAGFRAVMSGVAAGALGPRVTRADIGIRENSALVTLRRPEGAIDQVLLKTRTTGGVCSRYFKVYPLTDIDSAELDALATQLDEAFPTNPWTGEDPLTAAPASAKHQCGGVPWLDALASGEAGCLRALSTLVGACFLLGWGLVLVWRSAPTAPDPGQPPSRLR